MDGREFKDAVFGHFARIGAALGHAKRVEIVDVLAQGERSVEVLAQQVASSVANTSRHLQILAAAGLVTRRAEGTTRVYRLADPSVLAAYQSLVALSEERLAEVRTVADSFFAEADGVRPVTFDELDDMAREGEVVVVDVRPAVEFASGHVAGAINIPLPELAARMSELARSAHVVAYCRGPYCVMSAAAVRQLRAAGYDAVRLAAAAPPFARRRTPRRRVSSSSRTVSA